MNVPRKQTTVPEMVEYARTHRIPILAVVPSTIWTYRSIAKIVQAGNANDVRLFHSLAILAHNLNYIILNKNWLYVSWNIWNWEWNFQKKYNFSINMRIFTSRKQFTVVDECQTGQNDCSPEATCTDTEDSYECACPAGYIDVSPDTARKPGRRCLLSKWQFDSLLVLSCLLIYLTSLVHLFVLPYLLLLS